MAPTNQAMQQTRDLTGFQRDVLFVMAAIGPAKGLDVKAELEAGRNEAVNHGRLYPNMDELVEGGYVEKGELDGRTNSYELTESGRDVLEGRAEWERRCLEGVEEREVPA